MKVVFHIGQPKTGTTAIQHLMFRNRDLLEAQGILYPKPNIKGINHGVLTIATHQCVQRSLVRRVGTNYEQALKTSLDAWSQVSKTVREKRPEVLLISSEFFFNAPDVNAISTLVDRFFPTVWDLSFICYLRPPSDWYASELQQTLKASHRIPECRAPKMWEVLEGFSSLGEVTARKFSRDTLQNENILDDFCSAMSVDISTLRSAANEKNKSLSAEGTILLQEYRRRHHSSRNDVFTDDTIKFIEKIREEEERTPNAYTKLRLRPEIAQYLDQESEGTRKIQEKFGVQLSKDHGTTTVDESNLAGISDAQDLILFDAALLERMRMALEWAFAPTQPTP